MGSAVLIFAPEKCAAMQVRLRLEYVRVLVGLLAVRSDTDLMDRIERCLRERLAPVCGSPCCE